MADRSTSVARTHNPGSASKKKSSKRLPPGPSTLAHSNGTANGTANGSTKGQKAVYYFGKTL